ncbi:hypothetical protein LCGC14_1398480 [marine sediment metagenome]|uniref:Uncharacterized protein n=1 Tax=marine sediment metagenome TaxID=412755 RepID=A0A0F9MZE1_9ZZZZ
MKKRIMLALIVLSFVFMSCVGTNKFTLTQCKETSATEKECMETTIEGKSDMLSF